MKNYSKYFFARYKNVYDFNFKGNGMFKLEQNMLTVPSVITQENNVNL